MEKESETFSMSKSRRLTRGHNIRKKFNKRMKFFLAQVGSCSYDDESDDDSDVPFRYKHLQKQWASNAFPQINIDFCVGEKIYCI